MKHYIDTNVFLYTIDKSSPYNSSCRKLLLRGENNGLNLTTSVETIQEIVHVVSRLQGRRDGMKIAELACKYVKDLISVDKDVIKKYLEIGKLYPDIESRDLIHAATCYVNKISTIITFDRGFKQFKGLKVLRPSEI